MEDSVEKILNHCDFKKGECYVLSVMARRKNNAGMTHSKEIMRRRVIRKFEQVPEAYAYLRGFAESDPNNMYYVYVSVNSRNIRKALSLFVRKLLDIIDIYNVEEDTVMNSIDKMPSLWHSCLENPSCRSKDKFFLVDVDDKGIVDEVEGTLPEGVLIKRHETRNGYHLVCKPFDKEKFLFRCQLFNEGVQKVGVKTDALLFIECIGGQKDV